MAALHVGAWEDPDDRRRLASSLEDNARKKTVAAAQGLRILTERATEYRDSKPTAERPTVAMVRDVEAAVKEARDVGNRHRQAERTLSALAVIGPVALMIAALAGVVASVAWALGAFDRDDPRRLATAANIAAIIQKAVSGEEIVHCETDARLRWSCTVQRARCRTRGRPGTCAEWRAGRSLHVRAVAAADRDPNLCPRGGVLPAKLELGAQRARPPALVATVTAKASQSDAATTTDHDTVSGEATTTAPATSNPESVRNGTPHDRAGIPVDLDATLIRRKVTAASETRKPPLHRKVSDKLACIYDSLRGEK